MTYFSPPIRIYLISFMIDRDAMVGFLDSRPEIVNWRTISPHAVLIASRSDLASLTNLIHTNVPWLFFLLTPLEGSNVSGWWTPDVWDFVNNPKSSGKWGD